MKFKRVAAIFKKQMKDTLKNKTVLLMFIIFPVIAFIFTEFVAKGSEEIPATFFVTIFTAMYVGMVPLVNVSGIIAEEKEKNTLRALIMSNVKPAEYLLGIGVYVTLFCMVGAVAFGLIGGFAGGELFRFVIALFAGILSSLALGCAIGLLSKNQMSATAISLPIALIPAFLPMITTFNTSFETVSRFLYTQQINYLINDLSADNFTYSRFLVIGINMVIFLCVFVIAYKKGSLAEQ